MRYSMLCVDDEPNILKSLERELRPWLLERKLNFLAANSGAEAMKILEKPQYNIAVVITDLRMPKIDGAALIQEIHKKYPNLNPILLTGFSDMEDIKKAIAAGINAFLQKPWEYKNLIQEIERALKDYKAKDERDRFSKLMAEELLWGKKLNEFLLTEAKSKCLENISIDFFYNPVSVSNCGGVLLWSVLLKPGKQMLVSFDLGVEGMKGTFLATKLINLMEKLVEEKVHNGSDFLVQLNDEIIASSFPIPNITLEVQVIIINENESKISVTNADMPPVMVQQGSKLEVIHIPGPGLGYQRISKFASQEIKLNKIQRVILTSGGMLIDGDDTHRIEDYISEFTSALNRPDFNIGRFFSIIETKNSNSFVKEGLICSITKES